MLRMTSEWRDPMKHEAGKKGQDGIPAEIRNAFNHVLELKKIFLEAADRSRCKVRVNR